MLYDETVKNIFDSKEHKCIFNALDILIWTVVVWKDQLRHDNVKNLRQMFYDKT